MLILEIAAGIVLAVVVLAFLPYIIIGATAVLLVVVGVDAVVGVGWGLISAMPPVPEQTQQFLSTISAVIVFGGVFIGLPVLWYKVPRKGVQMIIEMAYAQDYSRTA